MFRARQAHWGSLSALVALLVLLALAAPTAAAPPTIPPGQSGKHHPVKVCDGPAKPDTAQCDSHVQVDDGTGKPAATVGPAAYGPSDLQSAYALTSNGTGGTVAIVDAYDDPNAESDLSVYRSKYGLPVCTSGPGGCFSKVNQSGGTAYPAGDTGWSEEISLDLDMVSAICPNCHILLVEANSNSFNDLAAAVDYAAGVPGVVAISNSYGGGEWNGEQTFQSHYNHPGKVITASSGDSGYGVEFPAASRYVTAVGGTSLTKAANARGWSETAWSGAGSGCSVYITKPGWQTDNRCSRRTVADVSAVADPNTGVAVYDTYGVGGWLVFGGTSVAAPIVASVYALAGNTSSVNYGGYPYSHTGALNDVTSGNNGRCRPTSYLCSATTGYDGPTGLGTPKGTGGF
jgi:subtilase family serine protease